MLPTSELGLSPPGDTFSFFGDFFRLKKRSRPLNSPFLAAENALLELETAESREILTELRRACAQLERTILNFNCQKKKLRRLFYSSNGRLLARRGVCTRRRPAACTVPTGTALSSIPEASPQVVVSAAQQPPRHQNAWENVRNAAVPSKKLAAAMTRPETGSYSASENRSVSQSSPATKVGDSATSDAESKWIQVTKNTQKPKSSRPRPAAPLKTPKPPGTDMRDSNRPGISHGLKDSLKPVSQGGSLYQKLPTVLPIGPAKQAAEVSGNEGAKNTQKRSFRDALIGSASHPAALPLVGRKQDTFTLHPAAAIQPAVEAVPIDNRLRKAFAAPTPRPPLHHSLVRLEVSGVRHRNQAPARMWRELLREHGVTTVALYFPFSSRMELLIPQDHQSALHRLMAKMGLMAVPCDPYCRRDGNSSALSEAAIRRMIEHRIQSLSFFTHRVAVQQQADLIVLGIQTLPLAARTTLTASLNTTLRTRGLPPVSTSAPSSEAVILLE